MNNYHMGFFLNQKTILETRVSNMLHLRQKEVAILIALSRLTSDYFCLKSAHIIKTRAPLFEYRDGKNIF